MNPETSPVIENIYSVIKEPLLNKIKEDIQADRTHIMELKNYWEEFGSSIKKIGEDKPVKLAEANKKFKQKIYSLIETIYLKDEPHNLNIDFEKYVESIDEYLISLPQSQLRIQDAERFRVDPSDNFKLKFFKKTKRIILKISRLPLSITNFSRKIFKKELKQPRLWTHDIPLRNLVQYFLKEEFILSILPELEKIYSTKSQAYLKLLRLSEKNDELFFNSFFNGGTKYSSLDFNNEINESINLLDDYEKIIEEKFKLIYEEIYSRFDEAYRKAGTIELPRNNFEDKNLKKKHEEALSRYSKLKHGWNNTLFVLFDDWRLAELVGKIKSKNIERYLSITEASRFKLKEKVVPHIEMIIEHIIKSKNTIGSAGNNSDIKAVLQAEQKRNSRLTDSLIPKTINSLLDQNIPTLIDELEESFKSNLESLSKKIASHKSETYDQPIKDSDIDYISPYELIAFETFPRIIKTSAVVKQNVTNSLNDIQKDILDLDQISDFTIESAIALLDKENKTPDDAIHLAEDGLERAVLKARELTSKTLNINTLIESEFKSSVQKFNEGLIELTQTEKLQQVKIRVAKAKAIERTKIYKQRTINLIKNSLPIFISGAKKFKTDSQAYFVRLRKRLGIVGKHPAITSEISDFLAETQASIAKLPFVYQRLFQVEPLDDDRFFYGRNFELDKLNLAYNSWQKEYYAPAIILGEKGSGATSSINIFLNHLKPSVPVLRRALNETIFEEEKYLKFFQVLLENDSLKNVDHIAEYLNESESKKIIVLENIQHLFLKKVGGFQCLKQFLDLISKTNKKVFWLTTSTLYGWNYLQKVLSIADNFGYIVGLQNLQYEQIIEIILKRHRVSGYNIIYEPSAADLNSKAYKKISADKRQDYLKKKYFSELNNFARSNISLALMFWLRSIKDVTKDSITLGSLNDLDFSFLNSLSMEKVFALHSLILHDGLKEESFVLIQNQGYEFGKRMLMLLMDDGIIIKKNDQYWVNPLLYRQSVRLLQTKNILH